MPMEKEDLIGQRFNLWTVLEYAGRDKNGKHLWLCSCSCTTKKIVRGKDLRSGSTKSCGCYRRSAAAKAHTTHGESEQPGRPASKEYRTWQRIKARCTKPNDQNFKEYGGRGITVSPRWLHGENGKSGYECFLDDMGRRPPSKSSIDRYPDPNGNYEPGNVRWADAVEQSQNRRTVAWINFNGEAMVLMDALNASGNSYGRYRQFRIRLSQRREKIPSPQEIFDRMLATPNQHHQRRSDKNNLRLGT